MPIPSVRVARLLPPALLLAFCIAPALADEIVVADGGTVRGKVRGDRLELESASGHVSIPYSSLRRLSTLSGGTVRVELVDGSSLEGAPALDSVSLDQGLYDRSFAFAEIRTILWDPPSLRVLAGTAVPLELIRSLSSTSAEAGGSVAYCVTEPVAVDGKTVIARHAPAWGEVLGAGSGRNVDGGGKLGMRASGVAAIDGTEIPLQGVFQVEGGVDAGAIVAAGVFGLLGSGNAAEATHGSRFDAHTGADAEVGLLPRPPSPERVALQRQCEEYYSLPTEDFIPAERLRGHKVFAPVAQPLRVSVPISQLVRSEERYVQTVGLGALIMDSVSIPSATLEIDPRRKGGANLEITANVYVRPSYDRLVSLEYQLMAGERTVATAKLTAVDAEEGKVEAAKTRMQLTAEQLSALTSVDDPRLRIVMTAIEN